MESDTTKPRKRKVVETVHFNTQGRKEDAVNDEEALSREYYRDALGVKPKEDREYFYDFFLNMRAPAVPDRGLPSIEVFNAAGIRLADAAWDFGYRRHEDLQTMKWLPSAGMGGRVHQMDSGIYIYREPGGPWPDVDPIAEINPDDIKTEPDPDRPGQFIAHHIQSGRKAVGKNRIQAHKRLLDKLEHIESKASGGE